MYYGHLIYIIATIILSTGLYMVIASDSYVKKVIGLGIFQNSILIFYIAFGKIDGSIVPIDIDASGVLYTSPIPHVLMLTAIVVGFATLCVSLALIKMIKQEFGTISCKDLRPLRDRYNEYNSSTIPSSASRNKRQKKEIKV